MADLRGSDIEEMTKLADSVDQSADSVDRLADIARVGVSASAHIWVGGDGEWFRSDWAGKHDPTMRQAADVLRSMAQQIRANRDQQVTTSAADLGPTGGPGTSVQGGRSDGPYPWVPENQPGGPGNISGSVPGTPPSESAGRFSYDAFSFGERDDGLLVAPYTTDWNYGPAAAGSYYYRQLPGGGFELDAEVDGRSGAQAQLGGIYRGDALNAQGEIGVFLGGRSSGSAVLAVSDDGYLIDIEVDTFVGAEAYANADATYGMFGVGLAASATAGAGASADYVQEFDGRNMRSSVAAGAFTGAKVGVEGDVTLLGDDVSLGGAFGVSTGLGAGIEGGFALGLDEIGVEIDLGVALGLGFDASIDMSFDPVGVGGDLIDGGGTVIDAGKDVTGWISPWW